MTWNRSPDRLGDPDQEPIAAILITLKMVDDALADHRKRKSNEIIDSRVPGLTLRVKPSDCRWSVRSRLWNPVGLPYPDPARDYAGRSATFGLAVLAV